MRKGFLVANKGGFFVKAVTHMQDIKEGDLLGTTYSARTLDAMETFKAPTDGVVWHLPEYPIIYAGESPVSVLNLSDVIKVIENP
jgi:predicted deacylase